MKVLLVYPKFPDTFWSFKHAVTFIGKKAAYPPLGLLTVAALLPHAWEKRLVDLNVMNLNDPDLQWADYVFISAMAVQRSSVNEVIKRCKQAGVKIVAGGPLFTHEFEEFQDVDHMVLNEAEVTLPEFLRDLESGKTKRIYRTSGFADIQKTPVPAWDLVDMKRYASMSLQFSRGCPFNCEFCNVTALFGHIPRIKNASQILEELDVIYNLGWRGRIFFVDDNFIGNKRYLKKELLPALIEWRKGKRGIPFNTEASINLADDPELMAMMVEAGFDAVFIGIETPNEKSLAECNKKQNKNRDLAQSVRIIQRAGLEVQGGFIVGFDNDTPSIFKRQAQFIQQNGIVTAMVGLLQAPTGTPLYERLKREGRLLGKMSGNNDGTTNIVPKMDPALLQEGYKYLMEALYSPKNYYKRVRNFLRQYRKPKADIPLDMQRVLALFRANIRLGIIGKERLQYWKTIVWALVRRPRLLPEAITFAIYGYHFRKVAGI
ncbi:MAG: B12-binding domain-containing radical SAM protein [Deltaproteobacteria bacterium]|nr:DUF4070 domain-containing protein [Deltaproteobacteria bacterium]MBW2083035.1 DUF4070 domain-containing protein [Deltaproteobacteria bacterium]RLB86289.1 MAG: B12-binding domain-containing radical SAM protein [Deltaproteobacteria bacterium]HDM09602.1 DUF4070 domain-containing protein [Desulfobacteraceae bacterium]